MMNPEHFMLLSPSANRDKSWACEHCKNWKIKDIKICESCYYAFPEHYEHIAGKNEKRIDLIFHDEDMIIYDKIVQIANEENISKQDSIKRLLHYVKAIGKKNGE